MSASLSLSDQNPSLVEILHFSDFVFFYVAIGFIFRLAMRAFVSDSVTYEALLVPESIVFVPG